jgi:hypothetical protein
MHHPVFASSVRIIYDPTHLDPHNFKTIIFCVTSFLALGNFVGAISGNSWYLFEDLDFLLLHHDAVIDHDYPIRNGQLRSF